METSWPFLQLEREILADVTLFALRLARDRDRLVAPVHPGSGRLGDPDVRLVGLDHEQDAVLSDLRCLPRLEMLAAQLAIALDAGVDDPPIDRGSDLDPARPVLGAERRLDRGEMRRRHVHEPSTGNCRLPALAVAQAHLAHQHALLEVQLLAEGEDLDAAQVEPVPACRTEAQEQPVGQVDEVFVLDHPPGDVGLETVVATGEVGARVVYVVRLGLLGRAARGKITVAECAQRLAQPFLAELEAFVDQLPFAHDAPPFSIAMSLRRNRATSSGSRNR
jgi:hypothetical protein